MHFIFITQNVLPKFETATLPDIMKERKSTHRMKLKLPSGLFSAYLFDCDGTIADSMPLHYIAWKKALDEWDCVFDEKTFYECGGMSIADILALLNKKQRLNMPVDVVERRREILYYELLPQLKPIPEVLEHIQAQHGRIPFAVVSGSTRDSVTASLTAIQLLDKFDAMVCAGDYQKSKPDPECFLMAAEKLGVAPSTCLVFEDTEKGVQAAQLAGMSWVKVPPPWERESVPRKGEA
jgi:HAD superfamily hydrolase (TIGR01509 family)